MWVDKILECHTHLFNHPKPYAIQIHGNGPMFHHNNHLSNTLVAIFLGISKTLLVMQCFELWVIQVTYSINVMRNVCFPSAENNPSFANFSFHVARSTPTYYMLIPQSNRVQFSVEFTAWKIMMSSVNNMYLEHLIALTMVINGYIEKWRT
jgi:hypothetical protein